MVSFIISIDASYSMTSNFFELFLNEPFVKESEVIIVVDGCNNILVHNLLKKLIANNDNIKVYFKDKMGYGIANNFGVKMSQGEHLFFINSDVFTSSTCFQKMLTVLVSKRAECVQPLLLYPQTNTVQCAGTFFGPYFKDHLFDGNSAKAQIVQESGYRQALTSALYAMPRDVFNEYGGFDEFYFNKLESFELSYKLTLNHHRCLYLADAVAYHSRGAGRGQYKFDFRQQEAYFWSRFGNTIKPDICDYLTKQITQQMKQQTYYAIILNQIRSWPEILQNLPLNFSNIHEKFIDPYSEINLFDVLPNSFLSNPIPIAFIVSNIGQLRANKYWLELRGNPNDIIIDNYANLILTSEINSESP